MLHIVANPGLTLINEPTLIRVWNDITLLYEEIESFDGSDYKKEDEITIKVFPISQEGLQTNTIVLKNGAKQTVSLFYYGEYYKNTQLIPGYPRYFPNNMFRWGNEDPNTALMEGAETIAENVIDNITQEGNLISLNAQFNKTFPQFCDNSLLGIALPFIYAQENIYNQRPLAYRIFLDPLQAISSPNDFLLTGQPLTAPEEGKVKNVLFNDQTLTLKYGATPGGTFCGKQKAIYIQNVASGIEKPRLIWNSNNFSNFFNQGVWEGLEGTGDEPVNWENSPGIPLSSEVIYIRQDFEINIVNYNSFFIPNITFFQGKNYTPNLWLSNIVSNLNEIIIGYDNNVGFIIFLPKP